jgi:parallel beta-helix repeat protein
MMKTTFFSAFLIFILANNSYAGIFVSVSGNDTTGNGTIVTPYKTFSRASSDANPGDTILIRGGTFISRQSVNGNNGAMGQGINIMPYNNETVILDGTLSGINEYQGLLSVSRHFYTIKGIRIINSPGYGIYYSGCNNLIITECEIHRSYSCIIRGWGNNDTVENCICTNNVLKNENGALCLLGQGWPAGVSCGYDNTGTIVSRNLVLRNNKVSRTWGEGVYLIGCLDCVVEKNEIFNNFSVNLGIGRSRNITACNNYIYTSNDSLNRPDNNLRANGIYLANEMAAPANGFFVDSIIIANNIVAGCRNGIRFWLDPSNTSDSNVYSHVGIYYNVFSDIRERIINIDSIPLPGIQPEGCSFINNIAFSAPNASIIRNTGVWTVTNNDWVNALPSFASDPSNFIDDPSMIDPVSGGDVNGFELQLSSVCMGKGIPVANVLTDFWDSIRDLIAPTVGVFEIPYIVSKNEISNDRNEIDIYPNPSNSSIIVRCENGYQIFDYMGSLIKQSKQPTENIFIGDIPQGIYIIRTDNKTGRFVKK